MNASPTEHSSTKPIPYEAASSEQRAQALTDARQKLGGQVPMLTSEDWTLLLNERKPTLQLHVADATVTVAEGALTALESWVSIYHASHYEYPAYDEIEPEQFNYDAFYLARHLQAYANQAKVLLEADPELTAPLSVGQMRDIVNRLALGNAVAERVAEIMPPRMVAVQ